MTLIMRHVALLTHPHAGYSCGLNAPAPTRSRVVSLDQISLKLLPLREVASQTNVSPDSHARPHDETEGERERKETAREG